jgi:hypothetical protein
MWFPHTLRFDESAFFWIKIAFIDADFECLWFEWYALQIVNELANAFIRKYDQGCIFGQHLQRQIIEHKRRLVIQIQLDTRGLCMKGTVQWLRFKFKFKTKIDSKTNYFN